VDSLRQVFLLKKKGVWYLTPEGEAALKLTPVEMFNSSAQAYREWRDENPRQLASSSEKSSRVLDVAESASVEQSESDQEATLEETQQTAAEGIRQRIFSLNAYQFQDLVAALLRAMGYYTPFIAPRGKDGWVDVVAYQDPLGAVSLRIKVQITEVRHQMPFFAIFEFVSA